MDDIPTQVMDPRRRGRWGSPWVRTGSVIALTVGALLLAQAPVSAVPSGWTKPKRVFASSGAPPHSMKVDGAGAVHIAAQDGSNGIVYVTNVLGAWTQCRVSQKNDRHPSLALSGGLVHIAFARAHAGEEGIHTASGTAVDGGDCGWPILRRHAGQDSHPSLGAFGATLHMAFRTADHKLRYARGSTAPDPWTVLSTISGRCCTSPPSLDVTTGGSPRVAFGDGAGSDARGLKYAQRGSSKWKKAKVHGGRTKHVSLILDKSPGVFTPPSNAPKIMYVVRRAGTYLAAKGTSGTSGAWGFRYFGRRSAPPDLAHWSNRSAFIYGAGGRIWLTLSSGGIFYEVTISRSGKDGKPQVDLSGLSPVVTFARSTGSPGIYFTRG